MDLAFELALLSVPPSDRDKWAMILARANHHLGVGIVRNRGENAEREAHGVVAAGVDFAPKFDSSQESHLAWALGRHERYFPNLDRHLSLNKSAAIHIRTVEAKAGSNSPLVRMPFQFVAEAFEVDDYRGMTMREFRVLAAVYSAIGTDKARILYREGLLLRSSGLWNEGQIKAFAKSVLVSVEPLTVDQLRWTLDNLEDRGLFVRLTGKSKRHVFYSRTLTYKELKDHIFKTSRPPRSAEKAKAQLELLGLESEKTHNSP